MAHALSHPLATWRAAALAVLLAAGGPATAANTTRILDLEVAPGVTQRVMDVRPDAPIATIIGLSGGTEPLGIADNGRVNERCFPLYRTRTQLADHGIALLLVDAASDNSLYRTDYIASLARWARQQAGVPVWLVGGGAATNTTARIANALPAGDRIGTVFFAPRAPEVADTSRIERPTLVIYSGNEPQQDAPGFFASLTSAPVRQLIRLDGGGSGCPPILFPGLEVPFADNVAAFIRANNDATGPAPAFSANQAALSGAWANAATDSQGFVLDVVEDHFGDDTAFLFGGWFTYDTDVAGGVRWYTVQGALSAQGASILPIYQTLGGRFDSSQPSVTRAIGNATVAFADCSHASLDYAFDDGRSGHVPLARLLAGSGCAEGDGAAAPATVTAAAWSGAWADPSTSGQGFVFEFNPVQGVLFGAWYTFGAAAAGSDPGGQAWYTLQAPLVDGVMSLQDIGIHESTGGVFDQAAATSTTQVGSADLILHGCTSATLAYRFTGGSDAGQSGTLELARLTPAPATCTP